MANSLVNLAQNATSYVGPCDGCQFCGKKGLLILPLRYAVAPMEAKAPALPGHMGQHVKDVKLTHSSYTIRTMRQCHLVLFVVRKGDISPQCYAATAAGYLYQYAAENPPYDTPEFNCQPNTCGMNASMMAIDEAEEVEAAYLLLSPDPLTAAKLNELKDIKTLDALCATGQIVKFSPQAWLTGQRTGKHSQPHCLDATATGSAVAEFVLAKKDYGVFSGSLGKALLNSAFPLMCDTTDELGRWAATALVAPHLARLDSLGRYMARQQAVGVALYDHIGVTQELNDFRNDAINKVDDFLNETDAEQVTNRWKFDSLQSMREVKAGFESGMVSDVLNREVNSELHIRARHEPPFPEDPEELQHYKNFPGRYRTIYRDGREAWRREFPEKAAALEAELKEYRAKRPARVAHATAAAKAHWEAKYSPLLDHDAIQKLDKDFDAAEGTAMKLAAARVDDHLAWVLHDRFVSAFDLLYDRHNELSGFFFEVQSALCTAGMVGVAKSAATIDAWLELPVTDRKNIYMRGLLLNQEAIENEAKTALAAAEKVAMAAPSPDAISGATMYKALKGLIDAFRKADSAWDEYVREREKYRDSKNPKDRERWKNVYSDFHEKKRGEGAVLFKFSEMNRSLFRKGISNFEKRAVGYFGGLVFARMGKLAEEVSFQKLMYGIDPEKPFVDPKTKGDLPADKEPAKERRTPTGANPDEAAKKAKQDAAEVEAARKKMLTTAQYRHLQRLEGVTFTANEYVNRKSHMTSNYHHVRIGALLGAMETFALAGKLYKLYKNGEMSSIEWAETVGNLASVSSIACDLGYGLAKSVRETTKNAAVKGAADVVRGGWKLGAGALGTVAGGAALYADWLKLKEELGGANRTGATALLSIRIAVGVVNTGAGALAAYSYSGALFRRILVNTSLHNVRTRIALKYAARLAEKWALRIGLLRFIACGTGVALAVTVAEIGYQIYLYYQPGALEIWMKRCVLRNRSLKGNAFLTPDQEIEELAKAQQSIKMGV